MHTQAESASTNSKKKQRTISSTLRKRSEINASMSKCPPKKPERELLFIGKFFDSQCKKYSSSSENNYAREDIHESIIIPTIRIIFAIAAMGVMTVAGAQVVYRAVKWLRSDGGYERVISDDERIATIAAIDLLLAENIAPS